MVADQNKTISPRRHGGAEKTPGSRVIAYVAWDWEGKNKVYRGSTRMVADQNKTDLTTETRRRGENGAAHAVV
ncbi:MAG TPA: hypothetical protein VFB79_00335 [Candidatus Angelobacter sp.]|nr:hypothetical protein [Candidatus Angelobacter sp.]